MTSPEILRDEKFRMCIELASNSKGKYERYGAILIDGSGEIAGRGYNRAVYHNSFPGGKLNRIIYQGQVNHAEIEAVNDALSVGRSMAGAEIYVAGFFPREADRLFLHNTFTCNLCAKVMDNLGIRAVYVPSVQGWVERPVATVLAETKLLLGKKVKHEERINLTEGEFLITDLSL